jgi:hypothetical protein
MCDRGSDHLVGAERLVLVDERSALAVVTHPRHEVAQAHAVSGRAVVPRMPQVVEVQPLSADRSSGMRPSSLAVEVAATQGCALRPGKTSAVESWPTKRDRCSARSGRIAVGIPTTRLPGADLGGPRTTSPLDLSAKAARTRTKAAPPRGTAAALPAPRSALGARSRGRTAQPAGCLQIKAGSPVALRCLLGPSFLASESPARGHRVNCSPPGRRFAMPARWLRQPRAGAHSQGFRAC